MARSKARALVVVCLLWLCPAVSPAATVTWTGNVGPFWTTVIQDPVSGDVVDSNWSPSPPGPGDDLVYGASGQLESRDDYPALLLGSIEFADGAPSYTIVVDTLTIDLPASAPPVFKTHLVLNGAGIIAGAGQSFVIENAPQISQSFDDGGMPMMRYYTSGELTFTGSATAGEASYTAEAGFAALDDDALFRLPGGAIVFEGSSSAASGEFATGGGAGDLGRGGSIDFFGDSTAASAEFSNAGGHVGAALGGLTATGIGGTTTFHDTSGASSAHFTNLGTTSVGGLGGSTSFTGGTSAEQGAFTNEASTATGGIGGYTSFADTATAASGSFENKSGGVGEFSGGHTDFAGSSTAANGSFVNRGASLAAPGTGGLTRFFDGATAGSGTFTNEGATYFGTGGRTLFFDSSTAGTGTFVNQPGPSGLFGIVEFHEGASGGNGHFTNLGGDPGTTGGAVVFYDDSTAGDGIYENTGEGGTFTFNDQSTAGRGSFSTVDNAGGNSRIVFNEQSSAGEASFDIGGSSSIQFFEEASGGNATITVRNAPDGSPFGYGIVSVRGGTLGEAEITAEGGAGFGAGGANVSLQNAIATAGSANIVLGGGSAAGAGGAQAAFDYESSAGSATIAARGGTNGGAGAGVSFLRGGHGEGAFVTIDAGAFLNVSGNDGYGGTEIGALEGAGTFLLGSSLLTTGGLGASTEISGTIVDGAGYSGGQLTKNGMGILTLSGDNTYTGLTTVAAGTLINRGSIAGDVQVDSGATYGGTGRAGDVHVDAGGILAPGLSPGTLTVGDLFLDDAAILNFEFGVVSDLVVVEGDLTLDGVLNILPGLGFDGSGREIFSYGGTLTDNGLRIGSVPSGFSPEDFVFDFSTPGQVGIDYAPVPEPAVALLLGLAALAGLRRRATSSLP